MTRRVHVLVLRAPGINCEVETTHAFRRHGAVTEFVHIQRLLAEPELIEQCRIFAVPGGFAYGDDIAAGRVLANEMRHGLGDRLLRFIDAGGLAIGICNGFQVLAKLGLLPRARRADLGQEVSLMLNRSDHYECRWVHLRCEESRCVFLPGGTTLRMVVAHAEGNYVPRNRALHEYLAAEGFVALRYASADATGSAAAGRYPSNPNGSLDDVAGLTDRSGRVLGLMPHPDRSYLGWHMPDWSRRGLGAEGDGAEVFRGMVRVAAAEG